MKFEEINKRTGISLQLFAADQEPDDQGQVDTDTTDQEPNDVPTSFSKEELDREAGKRVSKALETARSKWQADQDSKLQDKIKEVERLAKLSETEKTEELERQRIKDLEDRENALTRKTLELDAVVELSNRKLPTTFKNMVIGNDAEETLENIKKFDEVFRESVQATVDERLKTKSPDGSGGSSESNGAGQRLAAARSELNKPVTNNPYFK